MISTIYESINRDETLKTIDINHAVNFDGISLFIDLNNRSKYCRFWELQDVGFLVISFRFKDGLGLSDADAAGCGSKTHLEKRDATGQKTILGLYERNKIGTKSMVHHG